MLKSVHVRMHLWKDKNKPLGRKFQGLEFLLPPQVRTLTTIPDERQRKLFAVSIFFATR